MEAILPRDMVNEILNRLPDHDLFSYGLTSKRSLESAEHIWKKRYEGLDDVEASELPTSAYWYCDYLHKSKDIFLNKIREGLGEFKNLHSSSEKKFFLDKLYTYIKNHFPILSRKSLNSFNRAVKDKLHDFVGSRFQNENEIGHKYYPLLYPKEYNQYLETKYLYESDETQEEPDFI